MRHKARQQAAGKPWVYVISGDRTFSAEVRVKRDESPLETNFGDLGSLWGSAAFSETARKPEI